MERLVDLSTVTMIMTLLLRLLSGTYHRLWNCVLVILYDRDTSRSRGFGFVTYGSQQEADEAINNMQEQELDGRRIKV